MPDTSLKAAVEAMAPGEVRTFRVAAGEGVLALRRHLGTTAHRAWGQGSYRTTVSADAVTLRRLERPVRTPPPAAPLPHAVGKVHTAASAFLTREQAAAWLAPYFPGGITAEQLRRHAARHTGPRHYRNGKVALYTPEDLAAWVQARIRPARTDPPHQAA